jgi:hypothetical protein
MHIYISGWIIHKLGWWRKRTSSFIHHIVSVINHVPTKKELFVSYIFIVFGFNLTVQPISFVEKGHHSSICSIRITHIHTYISQINWSNHRSFATVIHWTSDLIISLYKYVGLYLNLILIQNQIHVLYYYICVWILK